MIYTCPVCQGSGFVPRKMYEVPGITCSFGSYMNDNGVIQCNSCNGTGVIRKNDWIKCTDRMPPDMEPVIVTAFHRGFVVDAEPGEKFVSHDVRWNEKLQAWEVQEWNICEMEWTTWHDLEITHWMHRPEPAED